MEIVLPSMPTWHAALCARSNDFVPIKDLCCVSSCLGKSQSNFDSTRDQIYIYSFQLGILDKCHLAELPDTFRMKLTKHGEAAVRLTNSGRVRKGYGEVEYAFCLTRHTVNLRAA